MSDGKYSESVDVAVDNFQNVMGISSSKDTILLSWSSNQFSQRYDWANLWKSPILHCWRILKRFL